jgi:ubiquinone/menaquinone biosynthesis C-methylase UbiE
MPDTPPIDIRFEIRLNQDGVDWTRRTYDDIYSGDGIRQLDSFYRWLLRLIEPVPGRRLLDVATGEGLLPNFARSIHGLDAVGCDFSLEAAKIGEGEGDADFCVSSGEELPFPSASFDYVTCIGSLEHFLDMRAGAREMARVLRPGGTALILLPNTYSIINNVYNALKRGISTIDPQPLQRYAARAEWAMLLEECGLRVERTFKFERETPETLPEVLWYLRHPRALVRLAVGPFIPLNLSTCFVYRCRRAPELGS